MRIQVAINEGVLAVQVGDKSISLDPKRDSNSDFTFVSHAHTDHLSLRKKKRNVSRKILASRRLRRRRCGPITLKKSVPSRRSLQRKTPRRSRPF